MKKLFAAVLALIMLLALFGCRGADLPKTTESGSQTTNSGSQTEDQFSFEITWSYDGYYNSRTGELRNGYNEGLDKACVTTLMLTDEELQEIYFLLCGADFFELPDKIDENMVFCDPSYDLKITVQLGAESKTVIMYAPMNPVAEWPSYQDFGNAYYKIVDDYIRNSDEFKSLPPNTNLYE